jgi:hypothetical protein
MDDIRGLRSLLSGDAPMLRALRDLRVDQVDTATWVVRGLGPAARLHVIEGQTLVCSCRQYILSGGAPCVHHRAVERVRARGQHR